MKIFSILLISLFFSWFNGLTAQDTYPKIQGSTITCIGDTLSLKIKHPDNMVSKIYSYTLKESNDTMLVKDFKIRLPIDGKDIKDSLKVYLMTINNDTYRVEDSLKVVVNKPPVLEREIKSFIRNNDLFLEIEKKEEEKYHWESSNGTPAEGNVAKFSDPKISETKDYRLIITDKKTGCTSEIKYEYNPEGDSKEKNVFGSIDDNGIPSQSSKEVTKDTPIYECNILGENKSSKFKVLGAGIKFTITSEIDDDYIIKIWEWSTYKFKNFKKRTLPKNKIEIIDKKNEIFVFKEKETETDLQEYRYFRVKKSDVDARTISIVSNGCGQNWSITAGTIIVPVKLRWANDNTGRFEFAKDITLGPFFGVKKRMHRSKPMFISIGGTVGISSVSLNNRNSNPSISPSVTDLAAFTKAIGVVFEYDRLQAGMFLGTDQINNNDTSNGEAGYNWLYQNKPWFSIGFGYALINRPEKENKNKSSSKKN